MAPDTAVVLWREEVGPSVFAAPDAVGTAVLVATGNGEVHALAARTGDRLWKRGVGGVLRGIVRDRGRIFAAGDRERGRAFAISLRDGAEVWNRVVGAARHPPTIAGDRVLVATEGGDVYALDAATGAQAWHAELAAAAAASPVEAQGEVVVATRADTLVHLDGRTGAVAAQVPLPSGVSAAILPWRGVLLVPLHSGALLAYDPAARAVRWSADLGDPILAAPAPSDAGDAYVLTRAAEVWRVPASGGEPRRLADLGGAAVGSLTVAGGRIYVGRLDGTLFVLRPDGTVAWRTRFDDSIVAPVAVHGAAVYAPLLHGTIVRIERRR